jgi:pyruvate kinase
MIESKYKILVTLGPSSLEKNIIEQMEKEQVYLFRINLSHTKIEELEDVINKIRNHSQIPICLDSEGAQIRNQIMKIGEVFLNTNDRVKIHYDEVLGDTNNISFTPTNIARKFEVGDKIRIDFNSACIQVVEKKQTYITAKVINKGNVGSNKAVDLDRDISLDAITPKDKAAIKIGRKMGIKHYALSFAGSQNDVKMFREHTGYGTSLISKIESRDGLLNLNGIISESDEILIDRGDLSRQFRLEIIPFLQRRIISIAKANSVPVFVATNLLESMRSFPEPTRAEINDVISTLLMGGDGLVLAAETAIGGYPSEAVQMIRKLIKQLEKWTPNTSIAELLEY